jgi:prepilin-type N-terminal cleavage/methylation domain-containing protein/prepilin-type processing-associated H-X9-DG protein
MFNGKSNKKGFTLIELLVVIAIISLLMAIIVPSLNKVKHLASGVHCQSNQRQLMVAWLLYADENNSYLVGGNTVGTKIANRPWTYSWVRVPQDQDGTKISNTQIPTLDQELRGIERGYLYSYIEGTKVYHCKGAKEERYGGGYRSYSITGFMNGEYAMPENLGNYARLAAIKSTQIRLPQEKVVLVEMTDSRGWNMGSWVMDIFGTDWTDPFTIWHGDKGSLGFADGHAELHKWKSQSTKILAEEQLWGVNPDNYDGDRRDLNFMYSTFLPIKKP